MGAALARWSSGELPAAATTFLPKIPCGGSVRTVFVVPNTSLQYPRKSQTRTKRRGWWNAPDRAIVVVPATKRADDLDRALASPVRRGVRCLLRLSDAKLKLRTGARAENQTGNYRS